MQEWRHEKCALTTISERVPTDDSIITLYGNII